MSIIRTHKQRSFAVIDNEPIQDGRLSWEALGLLTYLLSKPDDWTLHVDHLIEMERGAGRDKVYRILKELEDAGYLVRRRERRPDGTFEWVRELYESPQAATSTPAPAGGDAPVSVETAPPADAQPLPGLPYMAEPDTAEPDTANPDILLNTESPNTEIIIDLDAAGVGRTLSPEVRRAFEQHCGLIASPLLADTMRQAEQTYPQAWILQAIELAGAAGPGKNNWRYVAGILGNWEREGKQTDKAGAGRANGHDPAGPHRPGQRHPDTPAPVLKDARRL